jgi:protein-S-isoprenylcysteine O-methyltransferase Ste14
MCYTATHLGKHMTVLVEVRVIERWRHLRSILLLPVTVTLFIPTIILVRSRAWRLGWGLSQLWQLLLVISGALCIGAGLWLLAQTIKLFATVGHGTLAPWDPPTRLVARGVYRHVRNPMISGVIAILLGESLALGSHPLAIWAAIVIGVNALYIPLLEEPQLELRFGESYQAYRRHVPRWLPCPRPWELPKERQRTEER